jgi:hypothetical protein
MRHSTKPLQSNDFAAAINLNFIFSGGLQAQGRQVKR